MATAKQRAAGAALRAKAARMAYKSSVSRTGVEYSPRAYFKNQNNAKVARIVGKSIAHSAAKPGKTKGPALVGGPKQKKAAVSPAHTDINYTKASKKAIVHVPFGEVMGGNKNIERQYKKNLRMLKRKAK